MTVTQFFTTASFAVFAESVPIHVIGYECMHYLLECHLLLVMCYLLQMFPVRGYACIILLQGSLL